MVLTQHEIKSRCWSNGGETNDFAMEINGKAYDNKGQYVMEAAESEADSNIASNPSNGYYGYQACSSAIKQDILYVNDCEMSMNCDNVQDCVKIDDNVFGKQPNSFNRSNSTVCQISTYLGCDERSSNHLSSATNFQRKRASDVNNDFNQSRKKLRYEESLASQDCELARQFLSAPTNNSYTSFRYNADAPRCLMGNNKRKKRYKNPYLTQDENLEDILLQSLHGSSTYYWLRSFTDCD